MDRRTIAGQGIVERRRLKAARIAFVREHRNETVDWLATEMRRLELYSPKTVMCDVRRLVAKIKGGKLL